MPLIIIILLAVAFRFYGLNWDQGQHFHPDERMITMVADKISWQEPNPHFFAYGSFPIYLLKITGSLVGFFDPQYGNYQSMNLVGRFLSALFDLGTIIILFLLGKKLFNQKVGLLASFFYTMAVLPIQLAHFYAVDTPLTFFTLATIYFLIQFLGHPKLKWSILIGLCFGLSLATKTNAILLIIPAIMTLVFSHWFNTKKLAVSSSLLALSTLITFFLTMPFAFLDFPTFLRQTLEQQEMTKSAFTFPYTLQYVGKTPYLYELQNVFFRGLGPLLATLAFAGTLLFTYKTFRPSLNTYHLILTTYFWLYFTIVGSFAIGFMRYMLPLYPLLCLFAAVFAHNVLLNFKLHFPNHKILNYTLYPITCTLLLIWPLSFLSIYSQPNTRNQTSNWIYQNIPPGSTIAREHWDDGLPAGNEVFYQFLELPLYDPDTPFKWVKVNQVLSQTDYIIIASNRLYTPLQKLTDCQVLPPGRCYPQTADYYQQLFNGSLGFVKVAEFAVYPSLSIYDLRLTINDIAADESFSVYDHPKVMIFKKI